jgi:hypothetical protein
MKWRKQEKKTRKASKKKTLEQRYLSYVPDLDEFIVKVCKERGLNPNDVTLLFGMDGGQGKFIVTLAILDPNRDPNTKEKFKSTGCHKILIPAIVRDIPENYDNLSVILESINLSELSKKYKVIGDLKIYNILLGMQHSSAMHACPYCEGSKQDITSKKTTKSGVWVLGRRRTLKNLLENLMSYLHESGGDRKQLQHYFNCEFPPILPGQEDQEVLYLLPIPYLHTILLGPFNDLWKCFLKTFGAPVKAWMKKKHMKGSGMGGDFNGPTIKGIIHNSDTLVDIQNSVPGSEDFVNTLRAMADLHNMVKQKQLAPDFETTIVTFMIHWDMLHFQYGLNYTLKIHIIQDHLRDVLFETGKTLGDENDEHVESAHHYLRVLSENHQYNVTQFSPIQGQKQHSMLIHVNSINC